MADIFLSHASKDVAIVDALVQLIEGRIGIRSDQIFCSSLEEQGVPPGQDFKSFIKEKLGESKVVVTVVSSQYYNSPFCMCELGATWALTKNFIPLIVPPISNSDLRGSLFGSQALPIGEEKKLDSMHSVLVPLASKAEPVVRWNSRKSQFLKQLPELINSLTPVKTLSEKDAEKLKAELEEYKTMFEKADGEVASFKKRVAELEKLKDKQQVAEVKKRYSGESDQFDDLVRSAKALTDKLPRVVTEALYKDYQGERFVPNHQEYGEDLETAVDTKLLRHDGNVFWANSDHPKVRRASEALDALKHFVQEPPEEFAQEYEEESDDLFDFTSRTFWQRHGLF